MNQNSEEFANLHDCKVHETLFSNFSSVYNFLYFKRVITPREKNCIPVKNSDKYAHLHSISFITTTIQKILLRRFRGVAMTNCIRSTCIFNFGQSFRFKRYITPKKKIWITIFCRYANLHSTYFITTKCHEILLIGLRGVAKTKKNPGLMEG